MNLSVSVQVVQTLQDLLQYRSNDRLLKRSIPLILFACVLNYIKHRACKDITYTHKCNFCYTFMLLIKLDCHKIFQKHSTKNNPRSIHLKLRFFFFWSLVLFHFIHLLLLVQWGHHTLRLLTSAKELHDEPEFILHHKGGVVGDNVGVAALAHGLDFFLLWERTKASQVFTFRLFIHFLETQLSFPFPDRI